MKCRACLALADETEIAREQLYALLPKFSPQALVTGNVETEDNVRGILCHTTFAIFSYACWLARVRGQLDPAVEKQEKAAFLAHVRSQTDAAGFDAASRQASGRYYAVLATIELSELDTEYKSNWGVTLSIELMLEHAFAHLIRHRRQLEVHLGVRPPGTIAGP
jgi:uncharacterized damage-inducible protein DinB